MTSLFGLFVGVLIEKFKNRYRTITYSIFSQKVKPSLSENLGGHLKISLGDREIDTLKVVTVEIENKSSVDIENVEVKFTLGKGAYFQGNEGFLQKNFSWLYWNYDFNNIYNKVLEDNNNTQTDNQTGLKIIPDELQQRIDFVLTNRNYLIPVFNRKEKAIFNFLIEDPVDGVEAKIFPSIVHKSINFIESVNDDKQALKDIWIGVGIGLIFVAAVITGVVHFNQEHKNLIIWSAVIGISYSIVGYLILYGFRKIRSFFK
ncbi:MAG: hypothetical protein CMP59_04230 [Flavobacteriales bacterium]|nr:hypothetical protein [Flavobacteriales bacterium]